METKTIQSLQLKQKSYVGLQLAQKQIHKVLKAMVCGMPIQYQMHADDKETVMVFIGNGICATLHVREFNPALIQEGGEV